MVCVDKPVRAKRNALRQSDCIGCESAIDSAFAVLPSKDGQVSCVQRDRTDLLQLPTKPANQNSKPANQNAIAMRQIDAPLKLREFPISSIELTHLPMGGDQPRLADICRMASGPVSVFAVGFRFVLMRIRTDRINASRIRPDRIIARRIRPDRISLDRIKLFFANQLKGANQNPSHFVHGIRSNSSNRLKSESSASCRGTGIHVLASGPPKWNWTVETGRKTANRHMQAMHQTLLQRPIEIIACQHGVRLPMAAA